MQLQLRYPNVEAPGCTPWRLQADRMRRIGGLRFGKRPTRVKARKSLGARISPIKKVPKHE